VPDEDCPERRRHPRYPLRVPVRAARGSEEPCAPGHSIDISLEGVLIRIPPVAPPARPGDRVLMSFRLPDGALHLIGTACRCERGADGDWYVAVEYSLVDPADRERLRALCEARWPDVEGGTRRPGPEGAGGELVGASADRA
jgi:hypothetical protein